MFDRIGAAHIPSDLIYGPVESRRFGVSLGVSFTPADRWVCSWRCPYCQLGNLPREMTAAWPSVDMLVSDLRAALVATPQVDVVTVAGSGEPTLHPHFVEVSRCLAAVCGEFGARFVLLTNADGLRACSEQVLGEMVASSYDEVWIKDDPGAPDGAWRSLDWPSSQGNASRYAWLQQRPSVHIQALLFAVDGGDGNSDASTCRQWCERMHGLQPAAIDLLSVSRDPTKPTIQAVPPAVLEHWHDQVSEACPQARVRVW